MEHIENLYNEYYRETDPDKRSSILDSIEKNITASGNLDELYKLTFVKEIYKLRYTPKKRHQSDADNFLLQCINLPYLMKNAVMVRFMIKKYLNDISTSLGLDKYDTYKDIEKEQLYREYRNTAACYLKTCDDGTYRSILGMVATDDESRSRQLVADFYDMTIGISDKLAIKDLMTPWNNAVLDELFETSEEYKKMFEEIK